MFDTIGNWLINICGIVGLGSIALILWLLGICGVLVLSKFIWEFILAWKEK